MAKQKTNEKLGEYIKESEKVIEQKEEENIMKRTKTNS